MFGRKTQKCQSVLTKFASNYIICKKYIKVKDMTKNEKRQNKRRIRGTDK